MAWSFIGYILKDDFIPHLLKNMYLEQQPWNWEEEERKLPLSFDAQIEVAMET